MTPYSSNSGKLSGVKFYEPGDDFIIVQFPSNEYKYSYKSCGKDATEAMKELAFAQEGLSTFISQVQPKYEWKR